MYMNGRDLAGGPLRERRQHLEDLVADLGSERRHPDDPAEHVFSVRPRESKSFFPKAAERARSALRKAGAEAPNLDAYV